MTNYSESAIYPAIQSLLDKARLAVEYCKQGPLVTYQQRSSLATAELLKNALSLIDKMASLVDSRQEIGANALSLLRCFQQWDQLFQRDSLLRQHGSLPFHILQQIRIKALKYSHYSDSKMRNYLAENREKLLQRTTALIGEDPCAKEIYDELKVQLLARWPDSGKRDRKDIDVLFGQLYTALFHNEQDPIKKMYPMLVFNAQHRACSELLEHLNHVLTSFSSANLVDLIPFFNPDLFAMTTSDMRSGNAHINLLVKVFFPASELFWVRRTNIQPLEYLLTFAEGERTVDLHDVYRKQMTRLLEFCGQFLSRSSSVQTQVATISLRETPETSTPATQPLRSEVGSVADLGDDSSGAVLVMPLQAFFQPSPLSCHRVPALQQFGHYSTPTTDTAAINSSAAAPDSYGLYL